MAGEFERVEGRGAATLWKCVTCKQVVRSQGKPRGHICQVTDEIIDTETTESVRSFFRGYQQYQTPNMETPLTSRAETIPHISQSAPLPGPTVPQPAPTGASPSFDMNQLLQFFQIQQDKTQEHLERQMQKQEDREKRMFDMMMESQKSFMHQQEKSQQELLKQQSEFVKNMEDKRRQDGDENEKDCSSKKKTKCPKWDDQESLESYCDRLELWNKLESSNKSKYLEFIDALQESGKKKEKERCVLEVRNKQIDPEKGCYQNYHCCFEKVVWSNRD